MSRKKIRLADITNINYALLKISEEKETTIEHKNNMRVSRNEIKCYEFKDCKNKLNKDRENAIKIMKTAKIVLERNFKDVVNRLQLDVVPECLYNITKCNQQDSFINHKELENNIFLANIYITEERHFLFCQHIQRNMLSRKQFPGSEMCLKIITEIMNYKFNDSRIKKSYILTELYHIFTEILRIFPPCHNKNSYYLLFFSKIKIEHLSERKQILPLILDLINDLIFNCETKCETDLIKNDAYENFYFWDQAQNKKSFRSLTRTEQFDRLFMVLDLLVRVIEYDTAVFVIKYSSQFKSFINRKINRTKLLIYFIIWEGNTINMNLTIKNIISIFIALNALKYPSDKIKIISRLLNIIANVTNMYEYPDNATKYPIYSYLTIDLINEIQKSIENSIYCSTDLWFNIINNLRSPLLKILLVDKLYSKIFKKSSPLSLCVPLKAISNGHFFNFHSSSFSSIKIDNKTERYPKYNKYFNNGTCEIKLTQEGFIKLMLIYSKEMIKYFHLNEILREIKNPEKNNSEIKNESVKKEISLVDSDSKYYEIDLNEKVNLRSIDLSFMNNINIQLSKDNCKFIRDEIKNIISIKKITKSLHVKYTFLFDEWIEHIKEL